jgi:hypothetical protein
MNRSLTLLLGLALATSAVACAVDSGASDSTTQESDLKKAQRISNKRKNSVLAVQLGSKTYLLFPGASIDTKLANPPQEFISEAPKGRDGVYDFTKGTHWGEVGSPCIGRERGITLYGTVGDEGTETLGYDNIVAGIACRMAE